MKKLGWFLCIFLLSHLTTQAQIPGCTDPQANNFNATATYHDGSCIYPPDNLPLTTVATLPVQLEEISGLIYYNGNLYGHPDSGGGTFLYEINPANGLITKTIFLDGTTNVDWEDITQDATHIYVCDTGNNLRGNRTDLKIYKFPKTAITAGTSITIPASVIETIFYSYEDQTDFNPRPANSTSYDCEAVAYNRGKLHLITKNWLGSNAAHYVLPTTAGTHLAQRFDEINTGNVKITGADFGAFDELILIGYENIGIAICALFLNYGFDGSYFYFNTGSKRRLDIGTAFSIGQVEAICFENALRGFIANERFNPISFINVLPRLRTFDITAFIREYYQHNQLTLTDITPEVGMIRFNTDTQKTEGYDGTHWVLFEN
jgi:hypothetical protein